jgi:hypothetical protein
LGKERMRGTKRKTENFLLKNKSWIEKIKLKRGRNKEREGEEE